MASKTPKRVSLKGRGADLFFGDYTPPEDPAVSVPISVDAGAPVAEAPSPPPSGAVDAAAEPVAILAPTVPAVGGSASTAEGRVGQGHKPSSKRASKSASELLSTRASMQAGGIDRSQARKLASTSTSVEERDQTSTAVVTAEAVEAIRRAVREPGREVAYVRLTPEEKGLVGDIVHAYKKRGQRTTENELHRIAINHLLQDYHEHGEGSVLARVLASLLA